MRQEAEQGDGSITKVDPIAQVGAETDKCGGHSLKLGKILSVEFLVMS